MIFNRDIKLEDTTIEIKRTKGTALRLEDLKKMTEIECKPRLNPGEPPRLMPDINPCICGVFDGFIPLKNLNHTNMAGNGIPHHLADNALIHVTSVVLTNDAEGWYEVICAECGRTGSMKAASGEGAIKIWNDETPIKNEKRINGDIS